MGAMLTTTNKMSSNTITTIKATTTRGCLFHPWWYNNISVYKCALFLILLLHQGQVPQVLGQTQDLYHSSASASASPFATLPTTTDSVLGSLVLLQLDHHQQQQLPSSITTTLSGSSRNTANRRGFAKSKRDSSNTAVGVQRRTFRRTLLGRGYSGDKSSTSPKNTASMSSSSSSIYEACNALVAKHMTSALLQAGDSTTSATTTATSLDSNHQQQLLLACLVNSLQDRQEQGEEDLKSWMLVLTGALVFLMQAGFAMLCAGCVRKKNLQNTMLKNLLDCCGAALAFYAIGYALAFGERDSESGKAAFVGTANFFSLGDNVDAAFWFFEFAFCATSATIVAGTLAERCQMAAYLAYSLFLSGVVYPVVAHSLWSNTGFLSPFLKDTSSLLNGMGAIDFAGGGVVHMTGGCTSLVAAYILGPRRGRFYDSRGRALDKPKAFPGHSIALQLLGVMMLWFGWYGFNCGSALLLSATPYTGKIAALAAINSSLAGAAGAVSALFTNLYLKERRTGEYSFDLTVSMNGSLTGLVAITSGCATIEYWAAICVGIVSGWAYMLGSHLLIKYRIDDAVDAIPVHMCGGMWGLLSVGLFSSPRNMMMSYGIDRHVGIFFEIANGRFDGILLANQIIALLFVFGWTTAVMTPFFLVLNYLGWFRSDSLEELIGLDISYNMGQADTQDDDVNSDEMRRLKKRGMRKFVKSEDVLKKKPVSRTTDDLENEDNEDDEEEDDDESSWGSNSPPSKTDEAV